MVDCALCGTKFEPPKRSPSKRSRGASLCSKSCVAKHAARGRAAKKEKKPRAVVTLDGVDFPPWFVPIALDDLLPIFDDDQPAA